MNRYILARIIGSVLLCGVLFDNSFAQGQPPDELLDVPILEDYGLWDATNLVWLDNQTLLLEPSRQNSNGGVIAYQYHIETQDLEILEKSPLYFEPTPEELDYYQIQYDVTYGLFDVYLSPFAEDVNPLDLIYLSTVQIKSGWGSLLVIAGEYWRENTDVGGVYYPINTAIDNIRVVWSRSRNSAVILYNSPVVIDQSMELVELDDDYDYETTHIGFLSASIDARMFALSTEGDRVLYSKLRLTGETLDLVLWEKSTTVGEGFIETRLSEQIIESQSDQYYTFAGANFIEGQDNQILALHADGLMLIDLDTDTRTLINPDLNAGWIRQGYFSPDNRYMALIYNGGIYVVETGFNR